MISRLLKKYVALMTVLVFLVSTTGVSFASMTMEEVKEKFFEEHFKNY